MAWPFQALIKGTKDNATARSQTYRHTHFGAFYNSLFTVGDETERSHFTIHGRVVTFRLFPAVWLGLGYSGRRNRLVDAKAIISYFALGGFGLSKGQVFIL